MLFAKTKITGHKSSYFITLTLRLLFVSYFTLSLLKQYNSKSNMEQTSNFILNITILQSPVFLVNSCFPFISILYKLFLYQRKKYNLPSSFECS